MSAECYTIEALLNGAPSLRALNPPARLAVFGDPVAHSASPPMHNAALRHLGLPWQYVRLRITPEELATALRQLSAAGFLGVNVTIPHKTSVLPYLHSVEPAAQRMGAVNTILVEGDQLRGFNTDGPGLVRAIREEFAVDLKDLRVLLLGAGGGAGRAIAVQCAMEGCERLVLVNRTQEKAQQLARELEEFFRSDRLVGPVNRLMAIPWEDSALREQIEQTDLIINASSVGMRLSDSPLLSQSLLTPNLMIYDTVYSAGKSRLLQDGEQAGARTANGLSMLLHQGALALEIWLNAVPPLEVMRQALQQHQAQN